MSERAFYRRRTPYVLAASASGALLCLACWFAAWSLVNPDGLAEVVADSLGQRLVVALPYALLTAPVLLWSLVRNLRRALDARPVLTLSPQGLTFRDWSVGTLPWREVRGVKYVHVAPNGDGRRRPESYLEVDVNAAESYVAKRHGGGTFSQEYLRRYFRIPLREIAAPKEVVRTELAGYREWAAR